MSVAPLPAFHHILRRNRTYAISYNSAYPPHFLRTGLILEELGDAPLLSTLRLTDTGPARPPAGG